MKKFTIFAALLIAFQIILPFSTTVNAEENSDLLNYLALGDSLAAGMNEKSEIGLGYTDFIAKNYIEEQEGIQYNKGFAHPGYTTVNVLNDIEENVTKPIYDLNGQSEETVAIKQAIQEADLITLSVGANDVLKYVNRPESGGITFDAAGVLKGVQEVSSNYDKIFKAIYSINPNVDIIVMGLYNPFPSIQDPATQTQLNMLVTTINNSIKNIVESNKGVFSGVAQLIAADSKTYLPNPANIHLSEAGYKVVAETMMNDYLNAIIKELEETISEEEIKVAPFHDVKNHWAKEYIDSAYTNGFMNGYEDGSFKPNTNMTRAQVLSVISRAFELKATKPAPFKDISHYAQQTQNQIAAAYEAGLVLENGGYFNPQGNITRSQLALVLMRLSNVLAGEEYETEELAPFKDIENYAYEAQAAITYLFDKGIVQGTSATTFSPQGNVTRAQLAKILVLANSKE